MTLSARRKGTTSDVDLQNGKGTGPPRLGRRPSTSRAQLSRIALELFSTRGFNETTTDDIAEAAGIGRRTLFRYSASKNDLVWGDFDIELKRLRRYLDILPTSLPTSRRSLLRSWSSSGSPTKSFHITGHGWNF